MNHKTIVDLAYQSSQQVANWTITTEIKRKD